MSDLRGAEIAVPAMPAPGSMVSVSPEFSPARLTGMVVRQDNPFAFDFLVHKGDQPLTGERRHQEYLKLIKYFLAALTVPDKDQWVNLSPYEGRRMIQDAFGRTGMGRDLLAQDYLLKQITSSLMYPEGRLGRDFWARVYARARRQLGSTDIPVSTFNKVWIVPDQAVVRESGNAAYVVKSHLKVMLEQDYAAARHNRRGARAEVLEIEDDPAASLHPQRTDGFPASRNQPAAAGGGGARSERTAALSSQITQSVIREMVLPVLEREVNDGRNFAPLRQIFASMLLATWYKKALRESLLGKVYADKAKVTGVEQPACRQAGTRCEANEAIYQQYLEAFKKGVYNYVKEDKDAYTQQLIPRKYFAGGAVNLYAGVAQILPVSREVLANGVEGEDDAVAVAIVPSGSDRAMAAGLSEVTLLDGTRVSASNVLATFWGMLQLARQGGSQWADALNALAAAARSRSRVSLPHRSLLFQFGLVDGEGYLQADVAPVFDNLTYSVLNGRKLLVHRPPFDPHAGSMVRLRTGATIPLAGAWQDIMGIDLLLGTAQGEQTLARLLSFVSGKGQLQPVDLNRMREVGLVFRPTKPASGAAQPVPLIAADTERFLTALADPIKPDVIPKSFPLVDPAMLGTRENARGQALQPSPPARQVPPQKQYAAALPYGGIDLNAANFDMDIQHDGRGVPLPLAQQDVARLGRIIGFVPHIVGICPAVALPSIRRDRQDVPAVSPLVHSS